MDIIAVNGAYLLALLIRFYIHFRFIRNVGNFREYYLQFTPYYTLLCLITFFLCGLYNGMWRYAGLNDMNRIIGACVITSIIQVAGTKLFVGSMPTSYYLIGGFLQFLMIAAIRFSSRLLHMTKRRSDKQKTWSIPAMVVGSGDNARAFIQHLEDSAPFQVAVIAGENSGRSMDGIPIVDYDSIPAQIHYHDIKAVFIADEALDEADRQAIRDAARDIEIVDYIEYLSHMAQAMPLSALLEIVEGPVTVVADGVERRFDSAHECLAAMGGRYMVGGIQGARIVLKRDGGAENR